MTFSLYLSDIADAIAAISIDGSITIKKHNEVTASWQALSNVLYPMPEEWITNFSLEQVTMLQGSSAPWDVSYTLNYRFLGTQVGDMNNFSKGYASLVEKFILIVNAIVSTFAPYSGKVEMKLGSIDIGPKTDPIGNDYFGVDFGLEIKEMQN